MEYQVEVKRVESQLTAVVRRRASSGELSRVVPQACGEVWTFVRSAGLPNPGRHLALYWDCEINLEVGAEVSQPFTGNDTVFCSRLPAGLVVTTAHIGPYHLLGGAHEAIRRWCAANGHSTAVPSWEVYGHWTDDPSRLRTDVYYLLQSDDAARGGGAP